MRLKSPEGVEDFAAFLDVFDRGECVVDLLMKAFIGDVRLSGWFSSRFARDGSRVGSSIDTVETAELDLSVTDVITG